MSQIRALRLANSRAIARHDISGIREAWSSDIHLICCGNVMFSGASALMASYQEDEFRNPAFVGRLEYADLIEVIEGAVLYPLVYFLVRGSERGDRYGRPDVPPSVQPVAHSNENSGQSLDHPGR